MYIFLNKNNVKKIVKGRIKNGKPGPRIGVIARMAGGWQLPGCGGGGTEPPQTAADACTLTAD